MSWKKYGQMLFWYVFLHRSQKMGIDFSSSRLFETLFNMSPFRVAVGYSFVAPLDSANRCDPPSS